uniref:DUF7950 domain-containing protein n=1 Tax=Tanacetum cinerariifolium TaxID=118510 RepID=A0A699GUV2_TANCI|nr:hypothetical protein [Tanacetum cinerariifolium]
MDMRYSGGCISRYGVRGYHGRYDASGYAGCGLYDISMVDRMMMTRFRPIAPRPVASVSGSGDSLTDLGGLSTRSKRKYVKVKSINKKKDNDGKKRKVMVIKSPDRAACGGERVVTLPLMPETPDRKENNHQMMVHDSRTRSSPMLLSFGNNSHDETSRESHVQTRTYLSQKIYGFAANHVTTCKPQTVSYLTVEHVTKAKVDSGLVGWREMENDSCPRFVSENNGDRVVWCNKAYKEMVAGGDHVVVVREDGELPVAFTCNVKVTCRGSMGCLTVPCDAWRLERGYAWRLDVKAALCLGR